ncbi:DUF3293 domain-containing protein [Luteimonas vadosa]|uniref:DUF3293 domain-containing protein n=1 Tax=Luteimonas vadosa TaxID=1165507 RepID=A0ABP9E5B7_9GAMM
MLTPARALPDGRLAELTKAYLSADYRWQCDGRWHHLHIGQPAPELERVEPGARCHGFLSGWDPWSIPRAEALNREADEALQACLLEAGKPFRPAFASAPNRTWREPSWLVSGMELTEFDALVQQFGQLGSLWWRTGEPVRLRMAARCPPGFSNVAWLDWIGA